MGKFLKSLTDGSLRCRYCGDSECDCMENGFTQVGMIGIWKYPSKNDSNFLHTFVQLRKQILPNGKKIPSGIKVYVPEGCMIHFDELLKTVTFTNDFLNRLKFK